ncbi:MAG: LysR substrate-binding domain-containing protein [Rhodospirillaceae bacterium]
MKLVEEFRSVDFTGNAHDEAIRIAGPPWPTAVSVHILETELIGPVISRDLAKRDGVATVNDPSRVAMVHTRTRPAASADWAAAAGTTLPQGADETWFDHYYFLLQELRAGLGMGVVPELLAPEDLARGQLIAPFGFVESDSSYLVATRADESRPEVWAFRPRVIEEFARDAQGA